MAFRFAVDGDLRFISHHDTMRLFERALSRSRLPARYTEGFNPRPKMSLPLPRPVGIASDAEWLLVEFDQPVDPDLALQKLAEQMPAGLQMQQAWSVPDGPIPAVERVDYEVPLPADLAAATSENIARLLASDSWPVQRPAANNKPGRTLDLRSQLIEASVNADTLRWSLRAAPDGSIRPAEMLAALGLVVEHWHHRIRRTAVRWSSASRKSTSNPENASIPWQTGRHDEAVPPDFRSSDGHGCQSSRTT